MLFMNQRHKLYHAPDEKPGGASTADTAGAETGSSQTAETADNDTQPAGSLAQFTQSDLDRILADRLARQRDQAQETMLDRCQVLVRTQIGTDAHNRPVHDYVPQPETVCGIKVATNREVETAGGVVIVDYLVRLPYGTAVSWQDRIHLTGQYGLADFTAIACDIVGAIQMGPTAVIVNLKELVHG